MANDHMYRGMVLSRARGVLGDEALRVAVHIDHSREMIEPARVTGKMALDIAPANREIN